MVKKLALVFLSSVLFIRNIYACDPDHDLKSELQQIRGQAKAQIPQKPDARVFAVGEELAKNYRGLAQKVCNTLWSNPEFQDLQQNLCVTLCGSVAWGEPTLKSDLEMMLLLKDYQHLPKAFQFTKTLLSAFQKLQDAHFRIDEGRKEEGLPSVLQEGFLWTFTPQDAVAYAFGETPIDTVSAYLKTLEMAFKTPEGTLSDLAFQIGDQKAIEFRGESLNVVHLSGNKEVFDQYVTLRNQKLSSLDTLYAVHKLTSGLLDCVHSIDKKGYFESEVKVYWRRISHVIRTLGLLTECSETGSLKTLNFMKEKGFLSDETYQDLLKKAQTSVWARLLASTGLYETKHVRAELLVANVGNDYMSHFFRQKLGCGEWFVTKDSKL